jgi:uncharacterized membrane protein YbhN (UPF0104 family)
MSTMNDVAAGTAPAILRFRGRFRRRRLVGVVVWLGAVAVAVVVVQLLGFDVRGGLNPLRHTVAEISLRCLFAGCLLQTLQTMLTAAGWWFILRAGFPERVPAYPRVLAAFATGVALNGFLPASIGTFAMLLMFVAIIPGATLPGVFAGAFVQNIFFVSAGTFVYAYLLLSAPGQFALQLGFLFDHVALVSGTLGAGALVAAVFLQAFWRRLKRLWRKAKQGGVILTRPAAYAVQVLLPSAGAWLAKLGVIAVFLAAYSIPVSFHTVLLVVGGKSVANTMSVTPGGVGIDQAVDVAAYSIGQQLVLTAWSTAFALALVVWAFGWSGGKLLVEQASGSARIRVADRRAQRRA